jgi:hypothetical protein
MSVASIIKSVGSLVGISAFQSDPLALRLIAAGIFLALLLWGVSKCIQSSAEFIKAKKGSKPK